MIDQLTLSAAQEAALDRVGEDCRVIGVWLDSPVVRRPDGQLLRISQNGRILHATQGLIEDMQSRVIDMVRPRLP